MKVSKVVIIVAKLLCLTNNAQAYDVTTGGYFAENGIFEWTNKEGKNEMKLNPRNPLLPTIIVVVVMGIITFVKIATQATFPTTYFIIWIVVSIILIGLTAWSWLRNKKK
jgi:uncharacterized membrane protein HdeD (DUF308 family)